MSKKITAIEAVDLSILVWEWLYEHPSAPKSMSPYWDQIKTMAAHCPMCELQKEYRDYSSTCVPCPLTSCKDKSDCATAGFYAWENAGTDKQSQRASRFILNKLYKYREDILAGKIDTITGGTICPM